METALCWFGKSAAVDNPVAQYNIGVAYSLGRGVEKDLSVCASWLEKSALQGNAPAQYNLGRMYFWGKGVARDSVKAMLWYKEAAGRGHVKAAESFARIEKNMRIEDADSIFSLDMQVGR